MEVVLAEELADKAIAWFVRLRADDILPAERNDFFLWLKEDREHQQAFIEIIKIWEGLAVIKDMDELQCFPGIKQFMQDQLSIASN